MNDETELGEMLKAVMPYVMELADIFFGMDLAVGEDRTTIHAIVPVKPKRTVLRVIEGGRK